MAKLIDLNGLAHVYSIIKGMLADKLGKNDVATVATSGSYNDLSDKPTIPSAYTLPTASSTVLGGVKVGNNISVSDGTISLNKSNVTSALGYTPPTSDTVYDNATTTTAGLMSASDKVKLNNIADNANNYIHPSTHPTSMITGLADVATSGSYNDLTDKPNIPAASAVDSELSSTSTNPVQNKVIKEALDGKLGKNETAARATQDGAGNNIVNTYAKKTDINGFVKTVNGTAPDTNGNVAINVGGGVSTSESNTWTGKQTFSDIDVGFEYYKTEFQGSSSATPTESVLLCQTLGNFTLNLSNIVSKIPNGRSTVFSAYLSCFSDGVLTITNAGTLYYVGNASDLALTGTGLLVNILIIKNTSGAVDSIVQSSKLEGGA